MEYTGLSDPRNADIFANAGFVNLLGRWLNGERRPLGDGSMLENSGFQWSYQLPFANSPGGVDAYDNATQFLGTYYATLIRGSDGSVNVRVENWSHWQSGTRLPNDCAEAYGASALLSDHDRDQGICAGQGVGGNLLQLYKFNINPGLTQEIQEGRTSRGPGAGLPLLGPANSLLHELCRVARAPRELLP